MTDNSAFNYLFSPGLLKGKTVRNRLVAQPVDMNCADDEGGVSDTLINRYAELARGRWGIVFIGAVSVTRESLAGERALVLDRYTLEGFKRLVGTFKEIDPDALLLLQLTHSGIASGSFSRKVSAWETGEDVEVLSYDDVLDIRDLFFRAAGLAWDAGADGVDIASCHGRLLGEFLRPSNRRRDDYGGELKNRTRLHKEIFRSMMLIHPAFIIGSRISLYEGIRGGCGTSAEGDELIEDPEDTLEATDCLMEAGADFFNVSAGIPELTPDLAFPGRSSMNNLYQHMRYAKEVKRRHPDTAVIGTAYSAALEEAPAVADESIARGYTDFTGFGRQSLADPLFPMRVYNGDPVRSCTLCGDCLGLGEAMKQGYCTVYGRNE